ncbi:MAG: carboxymuconolactone decarboxylase family protein, partial [Acidobacteria bacterium]
ELAAFRPRERVALEFAEAMTRDSTRVSDELFRRLREQFEEGEIVEIAAVAGLFSYFNRFNNALEMEPTR